MTVQISTMQFIALVITLCLLLGMIIMHLNERVEKRLEKQKEYADKD